LSSGWLKSRRMIFLGATVVVVAVVGVLVIRHFPAIVEVKGTITQLDLAERSALVEAIDPANGRSREFRGFAAPDCEVTIDGRRAKLADLRVGDTAQIRARVQRQAHNSDEAPPPTTHPTTQPAGDDQQAHSKHKTKHLLIAERIAVTRS